MTNATGGNSVLVFNRLPDDTLQRPTEFATGGLGTGGSLGNQSGLILDPSNRWLYAVNAGSHEISVFRITATGLQRRQTISSGGFRPISLAIYENLLYVLNAGGNVGQSDNVTGFRVGSSGTLAPLPGSTRSLSEAVTDPAQVAFTLDGTMVVVTEKATDRILTYRVQSNGRLSAPTTNDSAGATPFGFAFGKRGQLFVSEAFDGAPNASAVSSYTISPTGALRVISASVDTTQTAACWVVISNDGRFAYATNTGSGSISHYEINFQGGLGLVDGIAGETGGAGSGPLDLALTNNGRFLYALARLGGSIEAFRVNLLGNLTPIQSVDVPTSANGLAAR
jgi:6-phosphogluconolactonase (cycloisomerase 2 family)